MKQKQYSKPHDLILDVFTLCIDKEENSYVCDNRSSNTKIYLLGSRACNRVLRNIVGKHGFKLSHDDFKGINEDIEAEALHIYNVINPQVRVAKVGHDIHLDVCDQNCTRIVLSEGKVSVVTSGNNTPFISSPSSDAYCIPSDDKLLDLFPGLFNLSLDDTKLLLAWVTYILTHPKGSGTNYPILVARGSQGSAKTSMSKILRRLLDPRSVGVQKIPTKIDDLIVMAKFSHLLVFDNVRGFTQDMSDNFCLTSTGGSHTKRKLYSDTDEVISNLQVAVVLNGIHAFIDQSDFSERCLQLTLPPIPADKRKTEGVLLAEFERGLPKLMAGLLELAAKTLAKLPDAEVVSPERMLDFSLWIAAMELALPECNTEAYSDVEAGSIQRAYSANLKRATYDNLNENELAAAILDFAHEVEEWWGTPTELFNLLNKRYAENWSRSKYWPKTAISLSKKLNPLVTALASQDVIVEITRGKKRQISIEFIGEPAAKEALPVGTIDDETPEF